MVGLRLRRTGLLMGTEGRVCGPVVAWLVLEDVRGCSAKFGEVWCGDIQIRVADATFRDR